MRTGHHTLSSRDRWLTPTVRITPGSTRLEGKGCRRAQRCSDSLRVFGPGAALCLAASGLFRCSPDCSSRPLWRRRSFGRPGRPSPSSTSGSRTSGMPAAPCSAFRERWRDGPVVGGGERSAWDSSASRPDPCSSLPWSSTGIPSRPHRSRTCRSWRTTRWRSWGSACWSARRCRMSRRPSGWTP